MKKSRLATLCTALALFAAVAVATQAVAAGGGNDKKDPGKYVKIVSGTQAPDAVETVDGVPAAQAPGTYEQGALTSYGTGATLPVGTVVPMAAPSGCKDAGVNWKAGLSAAGLTVWKIWNHTHWCYNNWIVTSVAGYTDVYTAATWTSSNKSWGWSWWNPNGTARSYSRAHFCWGAYLACIQTADPEVSVWVNGAGNWSWDGSHYQS
jgi:hypothetical protein